MKYTAILLIIAFLSVPELNAQDDVEDTVRELANELVGQLSRRGPKKVAVYRLDYRGNDRSEISRYFADEMSFALSSARAPFTVVPCSKVDEQLNQENGRTSEVDNPLNDLEQGYEKRATTRDDEIDVIAAGSSLLSVGASMLMKNNKGVLSGVKGFVGGNIVDEGDQLLVTFEVLDKRSNILATARSRFAKTPKITRMLQQGPSLAARTYAPADQDFGSDGEDYDYEDNGSYAGDAITWKSNALFMELQGCTQNRQDVECTLQVTARDKNVKLYIYKNESFFLDAESMAEFSASEVSIADISTTSGRAEKLIIGGYQADVVLRFQDVSKRVDTAASLFIKIYEEQNHYQLIELKNVPFAH